MAGKKSKKKPMTPAEMGRLGGKMRAKLMTDEERSEAGRKAVLARWKNKKKNT